MPKKVVKKNESIQKENSVENRVKVPQKNNKKWWHFDRRI